jgi:hypothetical protein
LIDYFFFRYHKYVDLACKGIIAPEKLPPSERALHYHGLRSHYQIILWSMLEDDMNIQATDWGWKIQNGAIIPVMTDKETAPEYLTKVIRCNCKVVKKFKLLCKSVVYHSIKALTTIIFICMRYLLVFLI